MLGFDETEGFSDGVREGKSLGIVEGAFHMIQYNVITKVRPFRCLIMLTNGIHVQLDITHLKMD